MTLTTTYRQYTAAFLLLLYAFIATPVQLWHHHDVAKQFQHDTVKLQPTIKEQKGSIQTDGNCPVCQHQYTVYTHNNSNVLIAAPLAFSMHKGQYLLKVFTSPCFVYQNKGPPIFA
ncbi:MAG: hypothetical protein QM802_02860 [Agriterribacter sp.]